MADKTVTVNTDNSGSPTYTTLNAAFSGEDGAAFDAFTEVLYINCSGVTDDTTRALMGTGFASTSASHYVKTTGDNTQGKWNADAYILDCTVASNYVGVLDVRAEYSIVDGLQVTTTTTAYSPLLINVTGDIGIKIRNCIVKGTNNSGARIYAAGISGGAYQVTITNCIVYNLPNSDIRGIFFEGSNVCNVYNTTIVNCGTGVWQAVGTVNLTNCLFADCTVDAGGTISDTYCATTNDNTKGLTALGTGNRFSITKHFVGAADFHLDSTFADAINYGTDLSATFTTDIDGTTRPTGAGTWDIGADEYVSAVAIEQEGFRFRNDDGSESAATWKANQDTNITLAADTAARIRMLLNATGDPASIGAQLEYRYKPSGGAFGSWTKVN